MYNSGMSRDLELIKKQAKKDGITHDETEIQLWSDVYTADPNGRYPITEATGQLAFDRFQDVHGRMQRSKNPYFQTTAGILAFLVDQELMEAILQANLNVLGRPAIAIVRSAESPRFGLELMINMQQVLKIGGMGLASTLTHEVFGHAKNRMDFYTGLDASLLESQRAALVRAHFTQPSVKHPEESNAYQLQAAGVVHAIGQGINGFDQDSLQIAATWSQSVRRGYHQKWDKFIALRV